MTTVRIVDSLKYGGKLFAFFLGIALFGGGGMVVGGALAVPAIQTWFDSGAVQTAPLVGGVAVAGIGGIIWFTGMFALIYKLVSDAVATGAMRGLESDWTDDTLAETSNEVSEQSTQRAGETGPFSGEQAARQHESEQTVPRAASSHEQAVSANSETVQQEDVSEVKAESSAVEADSRERTAEEIAFGTASEQESVDRNEAATRAEKSADADAEFEWIEKEQDGRHHAGGDDKTELNSVDKAEPNSLDEKKSESVEEPSSDPLSDRQGSED